jgi:uncharacterized protein (TIGR00290 family)
MMARSKILLSWSSGKDSAWALHRLRAQGAVEIAGLLTVVNRDAGRVAMHAVRETLLAAQAKAAGLPLHTVFIPNPCPNEAYEQAMSEAMAEAHARGITHVAFGDLFLEDVRRYREEKLAGTGIAPLFPLWGEDTGRLSRTMVDAGLAAVITCVDPRQIDRRLAGRPFDHAFLNALPGSADPCGERGEFHSFVHAGPMFAEPIAIRTGDVVERDGFVFCDVIPAES